ncbi:MAG: hypothetical protein F6J93_31340 [Oscillatoria sp. SIO1A7]|nr:hypothetical protein [Oscillatoria sp. SIO1A7]
MNKDQQVAQKILDKSSGKEVPVNSSAQGAEAASKLAGSMAVRVEQAANNVKVSFAKAVAREVGSQMNDGKFSEAVIEELDPLFATMLCGLDAEYYVIEGKKDVPRLAAVKVS